MVVPLPLICIDWKTTAYIHTRVSPVSKIVRLSHATKNSLSIIIPRQGKWRNQTFMLIFCPVSYTVSSRVEYFG